VPVLFLIDRGFGLSGAETVPSRIALLAFAQMGGARRYPAGLVG
jgi:hypothetical protein